MGQRAELELRPSIAYIRRVIGLFWNDDERRLRAPWRLLIVTGLWFALLRIPATLFSLQPGETDLPIGRLTLYFVTLVLLVIGLIWIAGRVLDRRYFAEYGLHLSREWWIDFGFGVALGFVLVSSIFLVGVTTGSLTMVGISRRVLAVKPR